MLTLRGSIQHYDWGSPTTIPSFLGVPADGTPWAEVWYGAHPSHPATAQDPTSGGPAQPLDRVIAADPQGWLGAGTRRRFGDALPYLVKLLATRRALSIQVHPDLEQAREGFRREQDEGVLPQERNYADPNHKPETIIALSPLRALVGFRPAAESLEDFRLLPGMQTVCSALMTAPEEVGIEKAFLAIQDMTPDEVGRTLGALGGIAGSAALALAADLSTLFPDDRGALVSILLREVHVEPGQALSTGAGVVHAYLEGFGLEVMSSSDNVLRAGLTSKRIDVAEFCATADFHPGTAAVRTLSVTWPAPGVSVSELDTGVPDFCVGIIDIREPGHVEIGGDGRSTLLVALEGTAILTDVGGRVAVAPGDAVLASADDGVRVEGNARLAAVTVRGSDGGGVSIAPVARDMLRVP